MNSKKGYPKSLWCALTALGVLWIQSVNLVEGQDALAVYKRLLADYKNIKPNDKQSDCNVKDIKKDDPEHHGWGTLTTLEYLTGNRNPNGKGLTHGESLNDVAKLRIYLARVGYLKVPGSLVFLNKQTETLRLEGCNNDNAIWRMQGERGMDKEFDKTGKQLKIPAPNAANYIHKFTCIVMGKCSHTFYVITRPLPDLPQSVQLREKDEMKNDDFLLSCGVPYCNIKTCHIGKTDVVASRRSYPPYKISWSVNNRDGKNDKIYQGSIKEKLKNGIAQPAGETKYTNNEFKLVVFWTHHVRKDKDLPETEKSSYKLATPAEWTDAFGEEIKADIMYNFNSRIVFKNPVKENVSGPYECIIEDGNGVVSTPSVFPGSRDWIDYRGRINVFVISSLYLIICVGVSAACIVGVCIIILICPKKMEYDDGTLYTKDELVAPAAKQNDMEPDYIGAGSPSQEIDGSKKSMKSGKTDKSSSSMKQHEE